MNQTPPSLPSSPSTPVHWSRELLAVVVVMLVSVGVMSFFTRQWLLPPEINRHYSGDNWASMTWVQTIVEDGSHLHNSRLGKPLGTDWSGYPSSGGWMNWMLMRGLALIHPNAGWVLNVFYWLTFPLTGLVSYVVCRRLGISPLLAMSASILFTLMPYHYYRAPHIFLASYFTIPVAVLAAVRLWERYPDLGRWNRGTAAWVAMAVFTATGNVYYTVFANWIFLAVGLARSLQERTWRPIVLAVVWCGIATGTFIATVLPEVRYQMTHMKNSDRPKRGAAEAEHYGLKPIQLFLPTPNHHIRSFASLQLSYQRFTPLSNENTFSSLGLVGAFGLTLLLFRAVFRWPVNPTATETAIGFMAVIILGFVSIGGLGSMVNWMQQRISMDPWIRGYNRGSIVLAFLALAGLALYWEQRRCRLTTPRGAVVFAGVLALVTAWGVFDQAPGGMWRHYERMKQVADEDRQYFAEVESQAAPGGYVFILGYRYFPECGIEPLTDYHLLRPYLNTKTLTYNYGALHGEGNDNWCRQLASRPAAEIVDYLARMEAHGILIFRDSYKDKGVEIETELTRVLGRPPLVSPAGDFAFFALGEHTARLKAGTPPDQWARTKVKHSHPLAPAWKEPFSEDSRHGDIRVMTRFFSRNAPIQFINELPDTRSMEFGCRIESASKSNEGQTCWLKVVGVNCDEIFEIPPEGKTIRVKFDVPPGEHLLRFISSADRESLENASKLKRTNLQMSEVSWAEK